MQHVDRHWTTIGQHQIHPARVATVHSCLDVGMKMVIGGSVSEAAVDVIDHR